MREKGRHEAEYNGIIILVLVYYDVGILLVLFVYYYIIVSSYS